MTVSEPPKGKVTEEEQAAFARLWARLWQSIGWSPPAPSVPLDSPWLVGYRDGRSAGEAELARLQAELERVRDERDVFVKGFRSRDELCGSTEDYEKARALLAALDSSQFAAESQAVGGDPVKPLSETSGQGVPGITAPDRQAVPTTDNRAADKPAKKGG